MPADLERQLPRLAEALDREAPAISVDEIFGRGTVVVAADSSERPPGNQAAPVNGAPWIGGAPDDAEGDELDLPIELAPVVAMRPPARRRLAWRVALAVAAAALLVVALTALMRADGEHQPADVPTPTVPAPPPTTTGSAAAGGRMWPQSTLEEARAAQERADAGDPDYTWQLAPQLIDDQDFAGVGEIELVDRFMREVLGWDAYIFNLYAGGGSPRDGVLSDQRFVRCAPGRTNPLYPPGPEPLAGELCAPTIDDLTYEAVAIDLAQLDRQGREGIWVVTAWHRTIPFEQSDPAVVEAEATQELEEFLAARVAGAGAEGSVQVVGQPEVPLLYATTSGAPYERYEIEVDAGPSWPYGRMSFSTRLFADGGAHAVEQQLWWNPSEDWWLDANSTIEDGRPVTLTHASPDGEVTISAPSTWEGWLPGGFLEPEEHAVDVWFGSVWRDEKDFGSGERIELVDPVAYDAWCAANGGSPLLTAPGDALTIAQQVIADPDFETTAPVPAQIAGVEAVSIDVALAPGGEACGVGRTDVSRWIHALGFEPGSRLRLYLVDVPEGMSMETLAITVVAPQERFDEVIEETQPIIDSIEFHST